MSSCLTAVSRVGRYTVRSHLAQGGMTDVWLASAKAVGGFQKNVVIKTILPRLADDPDFVRVCIEEALLAAKLSPPNVIHIFDLGESECSYFIAWRPYQARRAATDTRTTRVRRRQWERRT